jgi:hypothetical protein
MASFIIVSNTYLHPFYTPHYKQVILDFCEDQQINLISCYILYRQVKLFVKVSLQK